MTRLRFGLDLDGVLADWHGAVRFLLSHYQDLELPPVEQLFRTWDGHLEYITPEQEKWLWTEGIALGVFRHLKVCKGAIEFCRRLDKLADIVIITKRPRLALQDTLDWLSFHRIPASEVHILTEEGQSKADISVDVALDDSPDNILDYLQGRRTLPLLWLRPWNAHLEYLALSPGEPFGKRPFYVCRTWEEVLWVTEQVKARLEAQLGRTTPIGEQLTIFQDQLKDERTITVSPDST